MYAYVTFSSAILIAVYLLTASIPLSFWQVGQQLQLKLLLCSLMFIPSISDVLEEKYQQYALNVPSFIYFYVLAPTCFGSNLPSSGSLLDPPELLENTN
jgi:hypothetical protein